MISMSVSLSSICRLSCLCRSSWFVEYWSIVDNLSNLVKELHITNYPRFNYKLPVIQLQVSHDSVTSYPWFNYKLPMIQLHVTIDSITNYPWFNYKLPMIQLQVTHDSITNYPWFNSICKLHHNFEYV
jgi:isopentenyldiphosphate isomerase